MTGTSISVQNSKFMLYPSITVCREPGVAHYKDGDMLELGSLHLEKFGIESKNATNTTNAYFLADTPDISDLLAHAQMITNQGSNMTTLKMNHTDAENREICHVTYVMNLLPDIIFCTNLQINIHDKC